MWSEVYLVVALVVDQVTGVNYGFLLHKPEAVSLLSLLSDWRPLYILQINLVAFAFTRCCMRRLRFSISCKREGIRITVRSGQAEPDSFSLSYSFHDSSLLVKPKPLKFGNVTIGGKELAFILGPCVIESEKFVWRMARTDRRNLRGRNRCRLFSKRRTTRRIGPRCVRFAESVSREGCEMLAAIGEKLKIPVTTDVHSPAEAEIAGEKIDVLQIPAFLCRQTDLLTRGGAKPGGSINVKKGQFLAPWDVRNIAEKLDAFGNDKFFFTERGTTFGYNNLVADMRSLYWMRDGRISRDFRCHSFRAASWRSGRCDFRRWRARAGAGARGGRRGLRRNFHGGARKSGARSFGWTESDSAKAVAEASSHVKSYSCCRFVAVASGPLRILRRGSRRALFVLLLMCASWFAAAWRQSKGHKP